MQTRSRDSFKRVYTVLHTMVAVSIVLIGLKVLIGFGKATVDVAAKGVEIVNDQISDIKYKLDEPNRQKAAAEANERAWDEGKRLTGEGARLIIANLDLLCKQTVDSGMTWPPPLLLIENDQSLKAYNRDLEIYKSSYIAYCKTTVPNILNTIKTDFSLSLIGRGSAHPSTWFTYNSDLLHFRNQHHPKSIDYSNIK